MKQSLTACCLLFLLGLPADAAQSPDDISIALDELLDGKRPLKSCRAEVSWWDHRRETSVAVHGDGLTIDWRGKQFWLSPEKCLEVLHHIKAARPTPRKEQTRPNGTYRQAKITLTIGDQTRVSQRFGAGVDDNFARLANHLSSICADHAAAGKGVVSIHDGLQKVMDGRIDPRAMKVQADGHRVREAYEEQTLDIDGLAASIWGKTQRFDQFGPTKTLDRYEGHTILRPEKFLAFVKVLHDARFADLPANLCIFEDAPKCIVVQVLDKKHTVHSFGFDPTMLVPDRRRRFDAVWQASIALHPRHETVR